MKKLVNGILAFCIISSPVFAQSKTEKLKLKPASKRSELYKSTEEQAQTWNDENISSRGRVGVSVGTVVLGKNRWEYSDDKKSLLTNLGFSLLNHDYLENSDEVDEAVSQLKAKTVEKVSLVDFSNEALDEVSLYLLEPFAYTKNKESLREGKIALKNVLKGLGLTEKNGAVVIVRASFLIPNGEDDDEIRIKVTQVVFVNKETSQAISLFLHEGSM